MATTIRTRDPRELLSLVPYRLGFRPEESAVVVSLRGGRGRAGLVARVDLTDLTDAQRGPQVARSLARHLVGDGARQALLVVYTAADARAGAGRAVVDRALEHLELASEHFVGPVPCWVVGPRGYHALGCEDLSCCPVGGRPLAELESTQVSAGMVVEGVAVAGSRSDLGRIVPASAQDRRSARRAAARWAVRARGARTTADLSRWRQDGLVIWRAELDRALQEVGGPVVTGAARADGPERGSLRWQPPAPPVLGRLRVALDDVLVRDAALLSFVPGAELLGERVAAGDVGPDVGVALQSIVDPVRGREPEPVTVAAARALLVQVCAHAPHAAHAPSLTLLAVLAWWEGDGARAAVLLEQALAADPTHRLALLLDEALERGMPPGWLRRRDPRT